MDILAEDPVEIEPKAPTTPPPTADSKAKNRLPEIPIAERAKINSQSDLDQTLAAHKRWVEAVLDPNVEVAAGRANIAGLDLRAYNLAGANLSGANLAGCLLTSCDLSRANLTVANLQGAQLQDANLQGAKLTRAKLDGADLRGADLTGANLNGVDLAKCILKSDQLKPSASAGVRAGASAAGPCRPAAVAEQGLDATGEATVETLPAHTTPQSANTLEADAKDAMQPLSEAGAASPEADLSATVQTTPPPPTCGG